MWHNVGLILIAVAVVAFIVILMTDKSTGARKDDRDSKKSDEISRDPRLLGKMQQPAELQVGEREETARPSRFEPDSKPVPRREVLPGNR